MKFYAVRIGRQPGVYPTWESCQAQILGFPGATFKSFPTRKEAEAFAFGPSNPVPRSRLKNVSPPKRQSSPHSIHVWVDGACLQHAEGGMKFGWAYVILQDDHELHRASGSNIPDDAGRHRNVAGEIMAVLQALAWCQTKGIKEATIYYDYQGLASWVEGSWKTNTALTQSYAAAVRRLDINLTWVKVKGHSGERYNELVDGMAREAAQAAGG